jgi:hypothetical protein
MLIRETLSGWDFNENAQKCCTFDRPCDKRISRITVFFCFFRREVAKARALPAFFSSSTSSSSWFFYRDKPEEEYLC